MQTLVDILNSIGEGLKTAIDFLGGFIEDLVKMAEMLAEGMATVPVWLGYFFPEELVFILVTVFAIVVIYKLLGREG